MDKMYKKYVTTTEDVKRKPKCSFFAAAASKFRRDISDEDKEKVRKYIVEVNSGVGKAFNLSR